MGRRLEKRARLTRMLAHALDIHIQAPQSTPASATGFAAHASR
ncbi:MAG: hypothetical protein WCF81_06840 [Roseiarcus sp.]